MKFLKNEKLKFLTNRRFLMIVSVVLIFAAVGYFLIQGRAVKANATASEQRTAVASKGTLSVTLSGSGTVSPTLKEEIVVLVEGEVEESYLEEGKSFKAGDPLLKIKDTDAQLAVKKLENSIKQKELAIGSQNLQNGALNVTAPISGRVSELNCRTGDLVNKGMPLMTIVDERTLQAAVTFENASTAQFSGIKTVQLQIPDFMTALTGQIKSLVQDGTDVHAVITVENPGALKSGIVAWAQANTGSGVITSTQGTLEVQSKTQVVAEAAGTVSNLLAFNDQNVNAGKLLLTLSGDDLAYSVEAQNLELEQAYLELEQARGKLENYTIKAPFDGVISKAADLKKGDKTKSGTVACTMMNTDEMTFSINIDELDITQVKTGQKVQVTAEALEDTANNPIEGMVTAIASEGSSTNGVTNYPVTVTIPGRENLKSGMNVDAVIKIFEKENALLVPIEAVQKQGNGYFVWVKSGQQTVPQEQSNPEDSASSDQNRATGNQRPNGQMIRNALPDGKNMENLTEEERAALRKKFEEQGLPAGATVGQGLRQNAASGYYSGAVMVKVTVGQHNESFMEITEGLNEGDIVVLPQMISNSSSNTAKMENSFMPMGGGGFVRQALPDVKRGN